MGFQQKVSLEERLQGGGEMCGKEKEAGSADIYLRDLAREGRRKMLRGGRGVCICLCV